MTPARTIGKVIANLIESKQKGWLIFILILFLFYYNNVVMASMHFLYYRGNGGLSIMRVIRYMVHSWREG